MINVGDYLRNMPIFSKLDRNAIFVFILFSMKIISGDFEC